VNVVTFVVWGVAQTAGSKRGFYNKKVHRVIITDDNAKSRPWKAQVTDAAAAVMAGRPLLEGALSAAFVFYLPRPKSHHGRRGLLPSAPAFPVVKPDALKLARAVEDALTGVVYRDDSQIVYESLWKAYGKPCVEITVAELSPGAATGIAAPGLFDEMPMLEGAQ